ncbi:hypothetical protein [Methanobrevibacter sp.]|uniref:hypothetical protein n=1 Tax=Methanobrevibacter sp. TaxID=66852 RepID=UPI003865C2E0
MNKKAILCLLILVGILSISHACATDNLDNVTCNTQNEDCDESISLNDDDGVLEDNDDEVGTFTDLEDLIRTSMGVVELDQDYRYCSEIDDKSFLSSGVRILGDVYLNGNGHTIYGNGVRSIEVLDGGYIEIYNLNFVNIYTPEKLKESSGSIDYGGAISNRANMYLENCTFANQYAKNGGAIYNNYFTTANLVINNCTFVNCSSANYGGAIYSLHTLYVIGSEFYNTSSNFGGSIYTNGEAYISNSSFKNSTASSDGGAIHNRNFYICDVFNSTFYQNTAQNGGSLKDCIAANCYFGNDNYATANGNYMYNGVNINCTGENDNAGNYFNTTNSTGFSFGVQRLLFNYNNETLDIIVSSNPGGERIGGVSLRLVFEDEEQNVRECIIDTVKGGIASLYLKSFSNGTYKMKVSFLDKRYNDTEMSYKVMIGKQNSLVSFSSSVIFEYGSVGSIYVNVEGGSVERKNIQVVGHPEANIDLDKNIILISGLEVGKYTLKVVSTPDDIHLAGEGVIDFSVKKAVAVIRASQLTVALKKGTLWSVYLVDPKTNRPIANMQLTLTVFTGSKSSIVHVTTNANGVATYKTSGLSKGTHKVIVSGTHPGYSFNTVTSSIKVIKPKQLTFKVQKRVNDKNGALISYVVKDKKTNKGINGVKINLLIYTGKKYKIITLKTKKSGKYNGAIGFSTNALSVGKHKVLVVPADIRYSGSAKTTMIIKKAAKKKPLYSHKL